MKNNFCVIVLLFLIISCSKEKSKANSYYNGVLTVYTDPAFKSVCTALAEGYMTSYPESNITIKTEKEALGFEALLNAKTKIAVLSHELSPKEIELYKTQTELEYQPAKFAADAVLFVVPKNSAITSITEEDIRNLMQQTDKKFIFEGANSSNVNFIISKYNLKTENLHFSVIKGADSLLTSLNKFPDKIGVVGYNTLSREYDSKTIALRNSVKILPIISKGKSVFPSIDNLRSMRYPFTRVLYFLVNESGFNAASGFIRYSCTQLGQLVVEKEGLQPYNMYKREVEMR